MKGDGTGERFSTSKEGKPGKKRRAKFGPTQENSKETKRKRKRRKAQKEG